MKRHHSTHNAFGHYRAIGVDGEAMLALMPAASAK
jgi:hypothetical protein